MSESSQSLNIISSFMSCCERGNLKMAKRLFVIEPDMITKRYFLEGFGIACEFGHLLILQWMYKIHPFIDISYQNEYCFRAALLNNHWHVAKWLLETKPTINLSVMNELPFYTVCMSGNIHLVRWFLSIHPTLQVCDQYHNAVEYVCVTNYLDIAQLLHSLHPIDFREKDCSIFRTVCVKGYVDMICWIISVASFKLSDFPCTITHVLLSLCANRHEKVLLRICREFPDWKNDLKQNEQLLAKCIYLTTIVNNSQVVQWLLSLYPSDNVLLVSNTLLTACMYGMFPIVKLICNRFQFNSYIYLLCLKEACTSGHFQIAKYILSKVDSSILFVSQLQITADELFNDDYVQGNILFYNACVDGHVHIAHWLYKQFPRVTEGINLNELFCIVCSVPHVDVIRFLHRKFSTEINLSYQQETPFFHLARHNSLSLAKWLVRVNPTIDVTAENHRAIEIAYKHAQGHYEFIRWMVLLKPQCYRLLTTETGHNLIINRSLQVLSHVKVSPTEEMVCVICYEAATVQTNCCHSYCETCIQSSFQVKSSCPYCRQLMTHLQKIIQDDSK